jgi:autotransporter-associated beta strand protein
VVIALIVLLCGLSLVPAAATPPSGYYLVWGDDFSGSSLDTTKWDYWCDNRNWGKAHNDGAEAVSVSNGHLVITTKTISGKTYTAMVASDNHFRPRYGYYEASIKWGDYSGMWSAFWLRSPILGTYLYDPLDDGGEMDVCEHRYLGKYGTNIANIVSDNIHWNGYGSQEQSTGSPNIGTGLGTGFHTFSLLWTSTSYDFGIDGSTAWHTGSDGSPPTPTFGSSAYIILSSQVDDGADVGTPPWAGYIPSGGYPTGTNQLIVDYFHYYAPTNVLFWTGGSSAYWTNSANWVAGMAPLATSDLTFSYLMATPSSILGSNYSVDGLVFLGMTASPTIGGTNTLTLGAGGIDMVAADQNVTLNAPVTLAANQQWTLGRNNPGNRLTLNAPLAGTATLTKAGYGTLLLNGTNSFSGVLNVDTGSSVTNDGALAITRSDAIANVASPIYIRNTGTGISTLQLSNSVTIPQAISLAGRSTNVAALEVLSGTGNTLAGGLTLASGGPFYGLQCDAGMLTLAGTVSAGSTATGTRALTLRGNGNFLVTGSIQNGSASALSLVKTNSGTLTLAGVNTYTGATTNSGGTLLLNGALAGPLVVNSGILAGTGSVAGDSTLAGGELSPGSASVNSIGTLTFGGNLILAPRTLTLMELNAAAQTNDQLIVAGTLTCGGTLYVANLQGALAPGQTFKLFNAGGYDQSFSALTLPSLDAPLAWDTTRLTTSGTLSVATVPSASITPALTNAECASTITLTALAAGTPPLTYQWLDNQNNPIAGATNPTLTLQDVTSAQAGNYTLQVANNVGTASALSALTVVDTAPPTITWSFTNLTLSAQTNCQARMPDLTGTNYIRAADACSAVLTITQTPTNNAVLPLGTNPVVLAVADNSGNLAYSTNTIVVVDAASHTLSIRDVGGGQLQLNWDCGLLQSATTAAGPYSNVSGATPPYLLPTTNLQQFYRLKGW